MFVITGVLTWQTTTCEAFQRCPTTPVDIQQACPVWKKFFEKHRRVDFDNLSKVLDNLGFLFELIFLGLRLDKLLLGLVFLFTAKLHPDLVDLKFNHIVLAK